MFEIGKEGQSIRCWVEDGIAYFLTGEMEFILLMWEWNSRRNTGKSCSFWKLHL